MVTHEPEPSVVEWGSDRAGRFLRVGALPWGSYAAWASAVAGGIAAFASLISDWQKLIDGFAPEPDQVALGVGLGLVWVWGGGWALGVMVLSGCTGLALAGPPVTKAGARAVGLAAGGVLLPFLAAAAVALRRTNQSLFTIGNPQVEVELGAAVPLAFLATGCFLVALWLAPRAARVVRPLRIGWRDPATPDGLAPWVSATLAFARRVSARRVRRREAASRAGLAGPGPPPPGDLTVEPTEPWVAPPEPDGGR